MTNELPEKQVETSGLLEEISKKGRKKRREVIYGVYDNKGDSLFVRLNDFMIDHSSVKVKEKSYFFHMLAVMVDAGIPAVQALKAYSGRTKNERFARILDTVAYNSEKGFSLSDSMSRFSDVFSEVEIGVIKSGEAVGQLGPMLFKLSEQVGRAHELRMKLWSASFYPLAVFGTLVVVAIAMLVWVFPTLLNLLNDSGVGFGELPFATKILIYAHTGLTQYWWALLGGVLIIYGLFKVYVGTETGAVSWDYFKLRLPVLGTLLRRVYVLQFVTLIGVLIGSGLPVIQALEITANSIPNKVFKLKIRDIIESVRNGGKISDCAARTAFLFPSEVVEMIRVGEKSAALGKVSEKVSEQYQMEIDHSLKRLTSVFEPVMILFVGLFVALLAVAVMAPIFNLGSSV
jgi:type IV pilus assembly protein PilC